MREGNIAAVQPNSARAREEEGSAAGGVGVLEGRQGTTNGFESE